MTKKELEIAQAACCVGTIWDQYEGTEEFNEMVGKRVQHLIELVRNHLEQEQPEVDLHREITHIWGKCVTEPKDQIACLHIESFIEIARHFARWGATHIKK